MGGGEAAVWKMIGDDGVVFLVYHIVHHTAQRHSHRRKTSATIAFAKVPKEHCAEVQ